jgi:hypothetical protein
LSNDKKIIEELDNIRDYLMNNKLKAVNFEVLDLTDIVEESDLKNLKMHKMKNQISDDLLGKDISLEDIVKNLLKPELQKWLNENLPNIVKQAVEKEIKKIIPKNE